MKNGLIIIDMLDGWALDNKRIGELMASKYGEMLREAYRELDVSVLYRSHVHGKGHIERTMLLGALIAKALELSEHESRMLLLCCSYHDIGRTNDYRDDNHGQAAARKFKDKNMLPKFNAYSADDFEIMRAAVALHSRSDKELTGVAEEYGIKDDSFVLFERIAKCLKDADNLDRVRIHDLDPKRLRHAESAAMVNDAQWILDSYNAAKHLR